MALHAVHTLSNFCANIFPTHCRGPAPYVNTLSRSPELLLEIWRTHLKDVYLSYTTPGLPSVWLKLVWVCETSRILVGTACHICSSITFRYFKATNLTILTIVNSC